MAFTAEPETARTVAFAEGRDTLHAVILGYATSGGDVDALLNTALVGMRQDAEITIAVSWPGVLDEGGLVVHWSHWIVGTVYQLGAVEYPLDAHSGAELVKAREIVGAAVSHNGALAAAQGALTALRARGGPHPDDPCDPLRE